MKFSVLIFLIILFLACSKHNDNICIDLSGMNLTKIPDSIYENSNIVYLNLGSKKKEIYPPLSTLQEKDTGFNHIQKIDEKIGNLKNLKELNLFSNSLKRLPKNIIKLQKLETLDISQNKDLKLVEEIDKFKKLKSLQILKIVNIPISQQQLKLLKSNLNSNVKIITEVDKY